MATRIQPYRADDIPRVKEFNRRLRRGGVSFQFPENHYSRRFPKTDGIGVFQEYFLALDDDRVCGGYILKHQLYSASGRPVTGAFYRLPISEGTIERRYAPLAVKLVQDALSKEPMLLGAGMGGLETPVAKLLALLRWGLHPVPFYFRIVRPARFFRRVRHLRTTRSRRILLDLLATSGLGWIAARVLQARPGRGVVRTPDFEQVDSFGPWADRLWQENNRHYAMVANRDRNTLNVLYPAGDPRYLRLRILDGERILGWAVALDTPMSDNKYFGSLRVGSIADTFSAPEAAPRVVRAATRFLERRGVDLIVSNQCHADWCRALGDCGYLEGPSNFVFGASPKVLELLEPFEENKRRVHLNRGDGDGPIHL